MFIHQLFFDWAACSSLGTVLEMEMDKARSLFLQGRGMSVTLADT